MIFTVVSAFLFAPTGGALRFSLSTTSHAASERVTTKAVKSAFEVGSLARVNLGDVQRQKRSKLQNFVNTVTNKPAATDFEIGSLVRINFRDGQKRNLSKLQGSVYTVVGPGKTNGSKDRVCLHQGSSGHVAGSSVGCFDPADLDVIIAGSFESKLIQLSNALSENYEDEVMNKFGMTYAEGAPTQCVHEMTALRQSFTRKLRESVSPWRVVLAKLINSNADVWKALGLAADQLMEFGLLAGMSSMRLRDAFNVFAGEVHQVNGRINKGILWLTGVFLPVVFLLNYAIHHSSFPGLLSILCYQFISYSSRKAAEESEILTQRSLLLDQAGKAVHDAVEAPFILWSGLADNRFLDAIVNATKGTVMHMSTILGDMMDSHEINYIASCRGFTDFWPTVSGIFVEKMLDLQPKVIFVAMKKRINGRTPLNKSTLYTVELPALARGILAQDLGNKELGMNYKPLIGIIDVDGTCDVTGRIVRNGLSDSGINASIAEVQCVDCVPEEGGDPLNSSLTRDAQRCIQQFRESSRGAPLLSHHGW